MNATNFWQTGGNNVTAGKFLGSVNNQPIEIWANNGRVLRLEPGPGAGPSLPNVIGGASGNFVTSGYGSATIGGGGITGLYVNSVINNYGTVSGGEGNSAGFASVVGGGFFNNSLGAYATVGGGMSNSVSGIGSFIGGGGYDGTSYQGNTNSGNADVIGGGVVNLIASGENDAFIGGGYMNTIQMNTPYSFLGGGHQNTIQSDTDHSFLGGGYQNSIQPYATDCVLGGGNQNSIQTNAYASVLGGGNGNSIQTSAYESFLGGGYQNSIQTSAYNSVIGGGDNNAITNGAYYSTIGGGVNNVVGGAGGTVPGGNGNGAIGVNSFAAGTFAQATNDGAFVWADLHYTAFDSTGPNQFLIRASGGVGINTNNPAGAALSVNGSITAPMWKATNVVNSAGPLTLNKSFTTSGGTLVIAASGTGYSTTAGATIGMDIKLDGTTIDSCLIYANPSATHMAFLPKTIVKTGVAAGSHTLVLAAHGSTTTDTTDNFCVTVQELPF